MAKKVIVLGVQAGDGTGTPLRTAGDMINDNFTELYYMISVLQANAGVYTDGSTSYRFIVREGILWADQTLTVLGFAGTESTDEGATGDWIKVTQFMQQ